MGTWGVGSFENDGASDWVYELEASPGLAFLEETLEAGLATGYLETTEGENAVGAAETVACLLGRPGEYIPESLENWVAANKLPVSPQLRAKAVAAVQRVQSEPSELLELWSEGEEAEAWRASLADLVVRLGPAGGPDRG